MDKTFKLNVILILIIAVLFVLSGSKMFQLLGPQAQKTNSVAQIDVTSNGVSALQSSPGVSSAIQNSELVSSSDGTNSNFWYNEKFVPGNVEITPSNTLTCNTEDYISIHGSWGSKSLGCYPIIGCISIPWYYTIVTPEYTNISSFVGYMGFPQTESGGLFGSGAPSCKVQTGNSATKFNYPNLVSADVSDTEIGSPGYCLPNYNTTILESGHTYSNNAGNYYPNFINWGPGAIKEYSNSGYYYAINNSFYVAGNGGPGAAVPAGSTLIIPAISCGSTFPNNYITFAFPGFSGVPAIVSLSGFTPSVGLASNYAGEGVTYTFGGVFWPPLSNFLFEYTTESIDPTFTYGRPTLDYAQFPAGNSGDSQYVNVSYLFAPSINASYFPSAGAANVSLYASNITFASITGLNTLTSWQSLLDTTLFNKLIYSVNEYNLFKLSAVNINVNAYSLPNLQAAYYPMLGTGDLSRAYTYDFFRTDGVTIV